MDVGNGQDFLDVEVMAAAGEDQRGSQRQDNTRHTPIVFRIA
jgi:hypothetical protein